MLLYHGTSATVARKAVTEGLKPRGKRKSNWEVASRNDLVYLTTAYAGYFAAAASNKDLWGIVEVDSAKLDDARFLPDEDFLEQATRTAEPDLPARSMKIRTKFYRTVLETYQKHWTMSLEHLGNCSYKGTIPPDAVTRVVLFDAEKSPEIASVFVDPCISILNYRFCGEKYRAMMGWLMGKDFDVRQLVFGAEDPFLQTYLQEIAKVYADRSSVTEVFSVGP